MCLASRSTSDNASMEPCVLVFYSHHRPHLADRDLGFFRKAQTVGWACEEIVTRKYPVRLFRTLMLFFCLWCNVVQPMFPEDPGEEEVRATVHGWRMTRGASATFFTKTSDLADKWSLITRATHRVVWCTIPSHTNSEFELNNWYACVPPRRLLV